MEHACREQLASVVADNGLAERGGVRMRLGMRQQGMEGGGSPRDTIEREIPKEFSHHRVGSIERLRDGTYAAELEWRLGKGFQPFMVARCSAEGRYLGVIANRMAITHARPRIRAKPADMLWRHGSPAGSSPSAPVRWLHAVAARFVPDLRPQIIDIMGRDDGHYNVTLERARLLGAPYLRNTVVDALGEPVRL